MCQAACSRRNRCARRGGARIAAAAHDAAAQARGRLAWRGNAARHRYVTCEECVIILYECWLQTGPVCSPAAVHWLPRCLMGCWTPWSHRAARGRQPLYCLFSWCEFYGFWVCHRDCVSFSFTTGNDYLCMSFYPFVFPISLTTGPACAESSGGSRLHPPKGPWMHRAVPGAPCTRRCRRRRWSGCKTQRGSGYHLHNQHRRSCAHPARTLCWVRWTIASF